MLVFIDEFGDTGRKIKQGSSRFFIISLVLFIDREEAINCDKRIDLLRKELNLSEDFEFHFSHNSKRIREVFLNAIQPYHFVYFSVVLDKSPSKLWGPGFSMKDSFYKYVCKMLFINALPYLNKAIVILDRSSSPDFRKRLAAYLRKNIESYDKQKIKRIKQQRSRSNNLLQLADYISGIINRKAQAKPDYHKYYRYISSKEILIQTWPK